MKFTLTYTGELKANGSVEHKHMLRSQFHSQLSVLWQQEPLVENHHWFRGGKPTKIDLNRRVGAFQFVPLVSPAIHLVCELKISMLRPEPPGSIVTQGGDIDNRLKTLLDALRVPKNLKEVPSSAEPGPSHNPFFCLLEDDALITGLSVDTERLLVAEKRATEVHLDIQVITRPTRVIVENRILGNIGLV